MNIRKLNVDFRPNTLSDTSLQKLKWCATIAVIGFPIMVQLLGAMILFSDQYVSLMSPLVLCLYAGVMLMVILCGLYAITNRVFLRFSGANSGLEEWEAKTQSDAYSFAYRIIIKGVLIAFFIVSILGALQVLNLTGLMNFNLNESIVLNVPGMAALTIMLTYIILLLPTLYIAWTLKPLNADEYDLAS
ncbi:MAG: hypothetical protein ACSHX3_01930 [Litorimonas sp.]